MLTETAKLSQSVLRCAIGLRKTGTVYFDNDKTAPGSDGASSEKKYRIYEESRYRKRIGRLSRAGLSLLLYIHFCDPDANGLVRYFDPAEAAGYIGCTRRTVLNNLHHLASEDFISMTRTEFYSGIYSLFITGYKNYFLPVSKGGSGYCVMHREVLDKAMSCRDINEIRTALRVLFDQTAIAQDRLPRDPEYPYYRNGLPKSVTRGAVKNIINNGSLFNGIFDVVPGKYNAVVRVKHDFDPLTLTGSLEKECENALVKHMEYPDDSSPAARLDQKNKGLLLPHIADLKDLGQKYPVSVVLAAVDRFIEDYVIRGSLASVRSVKAAVRTLARHIFHFRGVKGHDVLESLPEGYFLVMPG